MPATRWIVGIDPYSDTEQGWIVHREVPEFTAKWSIEGEDKAILDDLVYTDAGEPDAVAIHGFEWQELYDEPPSDELFRKVMALAVKAVDDYLLLIAEMASEE